MRKVLVTGATGFIGNHVVNALLQQDVQVIASSAQPDKAQAFPWFSRVQYVPFDFEQFDSAKNYFDLFGRPDIMIHLAWEGLPNYKSAFHEEQNLPRHTALIEQMVAGGLKDLLITGTCFEYGMVEGCLREDREPLPGNPYARAKDALRRAVAGMQGRYDFIFKWVRLFYMYGPGQNPKSLLSQLDQALAAGEPVFNMSGGEQVRDYLPVSSVADGIVRIALQQAVAGVVNCCSGEPITVKQLVTDYLRSKNASIELNLGYYPYPDYEPMSFWGDNTKFKTVI